MIKSLKYRFCDLGDLKDFHAQAAVCCNVLSSTQAQPEFFLSNPKGTYSVGFRIIKQYDLTRAYKSRLDEVPGEITQGETARLIQTLLWYPARSGGKRLSHVDYIRSRSTEENFDLPAARVDEQLAKNAKLMSDRLGVEQSRQMMDAPMLAAWDAPPVARKFPVVIYAAGGGGSADENADMCEYLASHGYVVIASTSLGAHAKPIIYSMDDAEPQVGDIEYLIGYAQSLPYADISKIAVVGWSWGGMNNVFAAARDHRIKALISFDGTREPEFTRRIPPQQITSPWLYISRTPDTVPALARSGIDTTFSLLNEAKYADVYQLTMYPMAHADFVTRRIRQTAESDYGDYSKTEVARAQSWVVRYSIEFLNAYLKQDPAGMAFVKNTPSKNGVPAHIMMAETRAADQLPPSRASFAADLAGRGFEHAPQLYSETQKRSSNFRLTESDLKNWGYGLLGRRMGKEAIEIFKLWVVNYPGNWDAFDSLGEAYEEDKKVDLAVEAFQRSVALNPKNENGKHRIRALTLHAGK